ncbi:MAG: glycoside hydrolase family 78, partial [Verrucomicrobiales bacterium VVV1]
MGGLACVFMAASFSVRAELVPLGLGCDGMTEPLAATAAPRLSWRLESAERGQIQTAWQILVASSAELLAKDKGDLWDSGKTVSGRTLSVTYAGSSLSSGGRYHWKVRCWDGGDLASAWSKPSVMEIAPLAPGDWHGARWIDDGRANPTRDEDFYQPDPAPLLRHEFTLTKPVLRARLHVAGLGFCLPSLNGSRLADQVLDPPWTPFDKRILFRSHDVTAQLSEGVNCLGLSLGNGWYNPLPLRMWGQRNIRDALAIGRPRVIACLVVEHPDGTRTTVSTGPGWTTSGGPTLRNSIFLGEVRDARLAQTGWDRAGFNASKWQPAKVNEAPLDVLRPLLEMPPVRATEPLPAVAVTTP